MGSAIRTMGLAVASVLAFGTARPNAAPNMPKPMRIVSLNACDDEYLIALADKNQIAALTRFARDPGFSFYAEKAKTYPISHDQAEAVLALRPDLVLTSPYQSADTLALLKGRVRIVAVPLSNTFEEVVKETRIIAAAIGQTARGETLIRSMQARVDAAGRRPLHGIAAHYQRGGFITGPGALMDDLMTRAGLINLARRLHGSIGQMPLEQIVYQHPDFLVITDSADARQDEGTLTLDHRP